MKTMEEWKASHTKFTRFAEPGDEIDEKIYWYFLECLPPHKWNGGYFQCGEPYSNEYGQEV